MPDDPVDPSTIGERDAPPISEKPYKIVFEANKCIAAGKCAEVSANWSMRASGSAQPIAFEMSVNERRSGGRTWGEQARLKGEIPSALDNKKNTVRPEGLEEGRSPRPQGRSFKFGKKADPESPRKGDGARW